MSYSAQTFSAGEQPTTSKWNLLWSNDASFNDGTGIAGLYKNLLTVDSNPYKFRAFRNAALNSVNAVSTKIAYDTENYDTNSNFDIPTGRYTAPVNGFYHFNSTFGVSNPSGYIQLGAYKNGSSASIGGQIFITNANTFTVTYSDDIQLTAGDYVEMIYYVDGVKTIYTGSDVCFFSGFLISRT